jgi:hypothetical protein
MTDEQLDSLEAVARNATPGPWNAVGQCVADSDRYVLANCNTNFSKGQVVSNAAYIAAANPAAVLELIAMVRSLQNERDYLAEHRPVRYCPTLQKWETCDLPNFDGPYLPLQCFKCWKESAREAVCQTN